MKTRSLSLSIAIAIAFLATTFQAKAQPKLEAEPLTKDYVTRLETLKMNDGQKTKVYDVFFAVAEANIPNMQQPGGQGGNNQGGQGGGQRQQGEGPRPAEGSITPDFILAMVFTQEGDAEAKTKKSMQSLLSADQYKGWEAIVKELASAERPQRPQRQ